MSAARSSPVALVTGGSGGIGSAIGRRLAEAGMRVLLTYNTNRSGAESVLASLAGNGHGAVQLALDRSDGTDQLVERLGSEYGRLDLLVNNAGFTRAVPHDDLDGLNDELIDQIFRVNWRGAFATVRATRDLLRSDGGGTIVNISSIAGRTGMGSNIAYCASKAALDSMTRSLARALAPEIRVVSVAPGLVAGDYAAQLPAQFVSAQEAHTPLQRIAQPQDVAEAVYAAAFHLRFTTGDIIAVDGGRPLGS